MNKISKENFQQILNSWIAKENIKINNICKKIGCSIATMERLLNNKTHPTDEMIKQVALLIEIGYKQYSKLSKAQKEKYSETIGTISGGGLGFASITAVVGSLGYAGLSAAGITSGLATLGGIIGGGMVAGISVIAAIPLAGLAAGFGLIKGIKFATQTYKLNVKEIDAKWEKEK